MKKIVLWIPVFGLTLILFHSCLKEPGKETNNSGANQNHTVKELNVPADFRWETSRETDLTINVSPSKTYTAKNRISVYDARPETGGRLISCGPATSDEPFRCRIALPAYIESVFVSKEDPFGTTAVTELSVANGKVEYTFQSGETNKPYWAGLYAKDIVSGPDCSTGCDEYISGNGNVNISGGKTYCIDGNFSGKISFQSYNGGGTLRICGTADLGNNSISMGLNSNIVVAKGGTLILKTLNMGNNATVTVYPDGSLNLNKLNSWSESTAIVNYGTISAIANSYARANFENYGTITFSNNFDLDRTSMANNGEMTVEENFSIYGDGSSFNNTGFLNVGGKFELDNNTVFVNENGIETEGLFQLNDQSGLINNGTIQVNDDAELNTGSGLINNCSFICQQEISVTGNASLVLNTAYLKGSQKINFWTGSTVDMQAGSMITTDNIETDSDISGSGDLNSIIIHHEANIYSNSLIDGSIEMATESGDLSSGSVYNFINGAGFTSIANAQNFLPVTACNPEGFGEPAIVDMDNDGVPDETDDYPADPDRAFDNYFPGEGSHATIAFEDLWPATGDYDFNDIVVAVFGNEVTNANNKLVDIHINFVVEAVGASLNNGLGFQLETIIPEMIESATGMVLEKGYVNLNENGTEAGQSKAVVIVTESVEDVINRAGGSMFNTIPENPQGAPDTTEITITFTSPVDRELIGPGTYNPFIIKDQDRSVEIHIPYYPPTDLMNTDLFGTEQDGSDPANGKYYVTENNLPWGMLILEPLDYPIEKTEITEAYNFFAAWAESGGNIYPDWYSNKTGYRNNSNIYGD